MEIKEIASLIEGKTLEEAKKLIKETKHTIRVVSENKVNLMVTMNFLFNRINVAIVDSIITEVRSLG